jgi:hypothetical protein
MVEFEGILETIPEEDVKLLISRFIAVFEFPEKYGSPYYFYHSARGLYKIFGYGAKSENNESWNLYRKEFEDKREVFKNFIVYMTNSVTRMVQISGIGLNCSEGYKESCKNALVPCLNNGSSLKNTPNANLPSFASVEDTLYLKNIIECEEEEENNNNISSSNSGNNNNNNNNNNNSLNIIVKNNPEWKEAQKYLIFEIFDLFYSVIAFCLKGINIVEEFGYENFDSILLKISNLERYARDAKKNVFLSRKYFFKEYNCVLENLYSEFIREYNK